MKNKIKSIIIITVFILVIFLINFANKHTVSSVKERVVPKTSTTENTVSNNDMDKKNGTTTKSESYSLSDIAGTYLLDTSKRDFDDSVPKELIDFTITIDENGEFTAYETPISSFIHTGKCRINDNILIIQKNYYKIENGKLIYIEKDSTNYHFVKLKDGDIFNKI
ncbi:MAG: hypothetical protein E7254_03575 [Lachnospiraceae bacterium]|nr:hypothetical protein [Lachnospiraceae bacterium]